ncbi:MAG: phage tail tape measure protein, partial [Rikenellaceae bacterium]
MAQEQNYSVNYMINVEATQGTRQVQAFADAVGNLIKAKADLTPAVNNIQKMMNDIDKAFRTKSGKKRDFTYTLSIKTDSTETKLKRIKDTLADIKELAGGINLAMHASGTINKSQLAKKVKDHRDKKLATDRSAEIREKANESVRSMLDAQKSITKVIGKINSALTHLERGREINIKTETAEERIRRLITLMRQLKGASNIPVNVATINQPNRSYIGSTVVPFAANPAYVLPPKVAEKLQEKLVTNKALGDQKAELNRTSLADKLNHQQGLIDAKGREWDRQRGVKAR